MLAARQSENIRRFVDAALPLSHWGQAYFDIRSMELSLVESMFGNPISRGGRRALDVGCGVGLASMFTPITHSEFIDNYGDQSEINSLEHYLMPMLNAGLRVLDVKPIREHAYGILAEKPADR